MFINVTKKAMPVFSALPTVADQAKAHEEAAAAPLWSWHANLLIHQRKKILVLVQDATGMTVVLVDVNAQRKKQLATLITDGIAQTFAAVGVDAGPYLAQAGKLEVNSTYSRAISAVVTNRILLLAHGLNYEPMDWTQPINVGLGVRGSQTPYISRKKALPTWPIDAFKAAAAKEFQS